MIHVLYQNKPFILSRRFSNGETELVNYEGQVVRLKKDDPSRLELLKNPTVQIAPSHFTLFDKRTKADLEALRQARLDWILTSAIRRPRSARSASLKAPSKAKGRRPRPRPEAISIPSTVDPVLAQMMLKYLNQPTGRGPGRGRAKPPREE